MYNYNTLFNLKNWKFSIYNIGLGYIKKISASLKIVKEKTYKQCYLEFY